MNEKQIVITYDEILNKWRADCWLSETEPEPELSYMLDEYFDAVYVAKKKNFFFGGLL